MRQRSSGSRTCTSKKCREHGKNGGLEVDLIVERSQQMFPIEVKGTTSPGPGDLQGIERFTALAPKRVRKGTLVNFGREKARLRGQP